MIRLLHVDLTGEALRARMLGNLAQQPSPELSGIHLVRSTGDLTDSDAAIRHRVHRSAAVAPTLTCGDCGA